MKKTASILLICFGIVLLLGCGPNYQIKPVSFKTPDVYNNAKSVAGVLVVAKAFVNVAETKEAFGFDIHKAGILPIQVVFDNKGPNQFEVNGDQTFLEDGEGNLWPILSNKIAYERNEMDEFIRPIVMVNQQERPVATVGDGDGIIFFNFRADRARQITRVFTDTGFDEFNRDLFPALSGYVCMTTYDKTFDLPVAFKPVLMTDLLGDVISRQGLRQLRIAETEKYAHVTYFFNGGVETPFPREERCLIPSPREIPTYDLKPEMSVYGVTDEVISRIKSGRYDLIVLNFANMDMVGHTGVLDAAVRACQVVDGCLKAIVAEVTAVGGTAVVTADHGNAERMAEEDGNPFTAHTTNPVPFILIDERRKHVTLKPGKLGDIAPTLLALMGIDQPEAMTGKSLLS